MTDIRPAAKAIFSLNSVVKRYLMQTDYQLRANFATQQIFPNEVYPGYKEENEKRKAMGLQHSTGEGARSIKSRLVSADDEGDVTAIYSFNDYLQFVDIGVGHGRKAEDIKRNKKAKYNNKYVRVWNPAKGDTHRPAIMMEMRHLTSRIGKYLIDFYGRQEEMYIVKTLKGIGPINI